MSTKPPGFALFPNALRLFCLACTALFLGFTSQVQAIQVVYVKADATGSNNGSSWANAFTTIPTALSSVRPTATNPVEIWVAKGTYYPPDSSRAGAIELTGYTRLLGGFAGTETLSSQANIYTNPTVLSGDIKSKQSTAITHHNSSGGRSMAFLTDPNFQDNAYNVVKISGIENILDGFIITGGNANSSFSIPDMITGSTDAPGEPISALRREVAGGGLFYDGPTTKDFNLTIIANCQFVNNSAALGGAVASRNSGIGFVGCTFEKNNATWGGGAIYGEDPISDMELCSFVGNTAAQDGGAIKYVTFNPTDEGTEAGLALTKKSVATLQQKLVKNYTNALPPHLAMIVGSTTALPGLIGRTPSASETATEMNNIIKPYLDLIKPEVEDTVNVPTLKPWLEVPVYVGEQEPRGADWRRAQLTLFHFTPETRIVRTTFEGNKAAVGGAASIQNANVIFDMCMFETNGATLMAGAIYSHVFTHVKVVSSAFYNNSGGKGASAVLNALNSRTHLLNCTIVENKSDSSTIGHAVASTSGSWIDVANCILWNNRSAGGTTGADLFTAIGNSMGSTAMDTLGTLSFDIVGFTDLTNSNVQSLGNLPPGDWSVIPSCFVKSAYGTHFGYVGDTVDPQCFYPEAGAVQMGEGYHKDVRTSKHNRSVDPLLTHKVKLTPTSPMIDAGATRNEIDQKIVSSLYGEDLGGSARVQNGRVDIGAYEGGTSPSRFYVNRAATGLNNGLTWANAFTNLHPALTTNNVEVWVAQGTYRPTEYPAGVGSSPQDYHFRIYGGTKIYGGFQAGATTLSERDPTRFPTILNGDIGVVGNDSDNAYNVVQFRSGAFGNAVMEGFTITKGRSDPGGDGAGIYIQDASPMIRNCVFTDNRATRYGGAVTSFGYQHVYLISCTFSNNFAQRWGGAVYSRSFLTIENGRFENNIGGGGGAVFFEPAASEMECTVVNSLFFNNQANTAQTGLYNSGYTWHGGAIYSLGTIGISHCTFSGNSVTVNSSTTTGGAAVEMGQSGKRISVANSILWNNRVTNSGTGVTSIETQQFKPTYTGAHQFTSIDNNIIEGYAGTNTVGYWNSIDDRDPQFVNAATGNLRLRSDSPAINAAGSYGSLLAIDLDRAPRLSGSARDLGAYEFQGIPTGINAAAQISTDCVNEIRVFRLSITATTAIPAGLNYQWEVNNGNGQGYLPVTNSTTYQGATTATLSITDPALALRGSRYRVRTTGTVQFTSRAVTLQFTPARLFVKANATGDASGGSWANAFTNIQHALAIAQPCSQIWVASGTYYPVTNNVVDQGADIRMRSGIAIYGGFAGTESTLAQRNWRTNITVISGNIGDPTSDTDNSSRLIYNNGAWDACDATAILDGFTLTAAVDGAIFNSDANPTIRNCIFTGNSGGFGSAMRVEDARGMTIENCVFKDNRTGYGTITVNQSTVTLLNCLIYKNRSTHRVGAISTIGTTNKPTNVRIINCTIADNYTRNESGALEAYGAGTNEIRNSIFWDNRAGALAAKSEASQLGASGGATLKITDSCIDGLSVVTNGNVGFNPLFVNSSSGDYSLSANSPLLDSGDRSFVAGITNDLAGKPRVFGATVDIGSYETQTNAASRVRLVSLPESVESCVAGVSPVTFTVVGVYDPTQVFQWQINTGSGFVTVTTNSSYQISTTTNSSTLTVQASLAMNGHQFRVAVPSKNYTAPAVSLTVRLPQIIYVRAAAVGLKNGTSWANAFTNLQQALTTADSCSEIWVAAGTYRPNAAPDGRLNYRMKAKLPIFGGFAGTETNRNQRNWTANLTILSNAPGQVLFDNRGDLDRIDHRSILDGFVLRSSINAINNDDGAEPSILNCTFENIGGNAIVNWESSSTISNCVFVGGSDVAIYNKSASPSITRSRFTSNRSSFRGAAIYLSDSSSVITDCVFEKNSGPFGGAISIEGESSPTILRSVFQSNTATSGAGALSHSGKFLHLESCLFTDNESGHSAAAIHNGGETITLQNCTVTYNRAARYGGGLYSQRGTVSIMDSIFWGNTIASSYGEPTIEEQQILGENSTVSVSNSAVQGLTAGTGNGNIGVHPLFVGVLPRPFELVSVSPGVNAGSSNPTLQSTLDLAGNPRRFNNGVVDMGAYELQANSGGSVSLLSVPVSQTVCVGNNAIFSVARGDTNVAVRWEVSSGSGFVNIANNATYNISTSSNVSSLTISNCTLSLNSNAYRIVLDSTGFQSPSAILTVREASTIYVKQGGAGLTNGTSWANAFSSLDAALDAAAGCSEIWVAQGTYTPASLNFKMKPLVGIYGGFVGDEISRTGRDWTNRITRLVGLPNSSVIVNYGVVSPMNALAVLDGFFITGSSTNEPAVHNDAASPTFRNCWFQNSAGIAMDNRNGANPMVNNCHFSGNRGAIVNINGSSPEILDCRFENNTVIGAIRNQSGSSPRIQRSYFANNQSETSGGAILNQFSSDALITECQFVSNTATESGGAIYNESSAPTLVNLSFQQNQAGYGGAICNDSTNLVIRHCSLYANHATGSGGAVFNKSGVVTLLGSILWNNREDDAFGDIESGQLNRFETGTNVVFNSCVEGLSEYAGNGNIDVDPLFLNPVTGNLQLMQQSPALNAGNTNHVTDLIVDAAGQPRVYGTNVDMGAYELQTTALAPLHIVASPSPVSACAGGSSVLTVTLTNATAIQWQVNPGTGFVTATNGNPFTIVESASSSSLLLTDMIAAWSGYQFRYVLPNVAFTSAPVALTISAPSVLYVDATATGTRNGLNWANAFTNLQEAINLASGCTEVWVADGTYRPVSVDGLLVPYRMKSGVGIYGGFAGNESTRAQRNWTNNLTILDAGGQGRLIYNYASTIPITGLAVLDGFTLTGATNNEAALENVSASPTIQNCKFVGNTRAVNNYFSRPTFISCLFENNSGGAMFNSSSPALISRAIFTGNSEGAIYNLESNPVIDQSTFTSNSAYAGGAILNSKSSPSIDRCSFISNSSGQGGGGAIANKNASKPSITSSVFKMNRTRGDGGALSMETGCDLVIRNSLLVGNYSDANGGAIAHAGVSLSLDNCTIAENTANHPAGGIFSTGTTIARNTILWGNRVVSAHQVVVPENAQVLKQSGTLDFAHCIIQGMNSLSGNSNILSDPLFVNRDSGNYQVNDFSPAINGGLDSASVGLSTDLNGSTRRYADATVDIGAYEFQGIASGVLNLTSQPESIVKCAGALAHFALSTPIGQNYTYTWQKLQGSNYVTIANGYPYTITSNAMDVLDVTLAMNGDTFRFLINGTPYVSSPFTLGVVPPGILYVNRNVASPGNGLSWSNAFSTIHAALTVADECSEIWVAAGEYSPNDAVGEPYGLKMKEGVRIYGGFAGTETLREQRNWTNNLTVLTSTENESSIDAHAPISRGTILDGFVITGLHRFNLSCWNGASPTIRNCTFQNNDIAAYNTQGSAPLYANCVFKNNFGGEAVYNNRANPEFVDCLFSDNTGGAVGLSGGTLSITGSTFSGNSNYQGAAITISSSSSAIIERSIFTGNVSYDGGAVKISDGSTAQIANSLFHRNRSIYYGGAISHYGAKLTLLNCTVAENVAGLKGGGMNLQGTSATTNTVVWGNRDGTSGSNIETAQLFTPGGSHSVAHSIVQGLTQFAGNQNIMFDPLFVNPGSSNFNLQTASPAINAGTNIVSASTKDLAGLSRTNGIRVDIGAYETTNSASSIFLTATPQSQSVCVGSIVTFAVAGTNGIGSTVQWQVNMGGGFVAIPADGRHQITVSSNASTLVVSDTLQTMNNWQYRFSITTAGYTATAVTLNVSPRGVIFVDRNATGTSTGANWANAFTNLSSAMLAADGCSSIWVAQGTYETSMLAMKPGAKLYGGFNKTEVSIDDRNWSNNVTILQGTNASIIYNGSTGVQRDSLLDGFTLKGASGDSAAIWNVECNPTIRNCRFEANPSGGIDNVRSSPLIENCQFVGNGRVAIGNRTQSSPAITNCLFASNAAENVIFSADSTLTIDNCIFQDNAGMRAGGAIEASSTTAVITRSIFRRNSSSFFSGGAIYAGAGSNFEIRNSLFYRNSGWSGGAIQGGSSVLKLINCTITENAAGRAGSGIEIQSGSLQITNSIIWNNALAPTANGGVEASQIHNLGGAVTVAYSTIQGLSTYAGNNNVPYDPLFVAVDSDDFRITNIAEGRSPAINAGLDSAISDILDLAGAPRKLGTVDMGAYEQTDLGYAALSLLAKPSSQSVCLGGTVTFTTTVQSGSGLQLQWLFDTGSGWNNFSPQPDGQLNNLPAHGSYTITNSGDTTTLTVSGMTPEMDGYKFNVMFNNQLRIPTATLTRRAPDVIYVNGAKSSNGDGASWATAFNDLQSALAVASSCAEVWVTAGTYKPTNTTNRNINFHLTKGAQVYGGFFGTETNRSQRNFESNQTILSGDIGTPNDPSDNSLWVVNVSTANGAVNGETILDGVIVEQGAIGVLQHQTSPTIRNCTIRSNIVSGISMSGSKGLISKSSIIGNLATNRAGLDVAFASAPRIEHSQFRNNLGGAISVSSSTLNLVNSIISGNTAFAGAAIQGDGTVKIFDSTITGNAAEFVGGIFISGNVAITNSILWKNITTSTYPYTTEQSQLEVYGNATVAFSCVQGLSQFAGNFNTSQDPRFESELEPRTAPSLAGDFRLQNCSPLLNAGQIVQQSLATDIAGNPRRFNNGIPDRGAYELQATPGSNITFSEHPSSFVYNSCTLNQLAVVASGATSYQWEMRLPGSSSFVPVINDATHSGAATATLSIANAALAMSGTEYRCQAANNTSCAVNSEIAVMKVFPTRLYVNAYAPNGGDGRSWTTAYRDLRSALVTTNVDACGVEIWVSQGNYTVPATSFKLRQKMAVYGGFNGTETTLNERDWEANITALDGEGRTIFNNDGDFGKIDNSAVLDGFTLQNANTAVFNFRAAPQFRNCNFRNNVRAIISVYTAPGSSTHKLVVQNCLFEQNGNGTGEGSAIYCADLGFRVEHSIFRGNHSATGGAIFNSCSTGATSSSVNNCVFSGNRADGGGAIYVGSSNAYLDVRNSTFTGNRADSSSAGAISASSAVYIYNSIFWNNTAQNPSTPEGHHLAAFGASIQVKNSCVQGLSSWTHPADQNVDRDPQFALATDPAAAPSVSGDSRLLQCSPLRNIGNNTYLDGTSSWPAITVDLDGNPRVYNGGTVDLGAYELQSDGVTPITVISQTTNLTYCSSGTNTFTVNAAGTGLTYAWEADRLNGNGFVALQADANHSNVTTSNLLISAATPAMNGFKYRCIISSSAGCVLRSATSTLGVNYNVLYVKATAPAGGNGQSWATAFQTIAQAMAAPYDPCGVQIWVAQGTNNLTASLALRNATAIYGGFIGTETNLTERNWQLNKTYLSSTVNNLINNSGALNSSARIDGFVIENRNTSSATRGAVLSSGANAVIANCVFRNNTTAIESFTSSPRIENCLFEGNGRYGVTPTTVSIGGIYAVGGSSPIIDHCIFRGNYGTSCSAIQSGTTEMTILNSLFTGNFSSNGATVDNSGGTMVIRNSTIAANRGHSSSGGIFNGVTLQVFNSIIWNNGPQERNQIYPGAGTITISNSCMQFLSSAGYLNKNNVNIDPVFVSPITSADAPSTNGNFRISGCSSLLNLGSDALVGSISTDLDGNPRLFGTVDMGAYEVQAMALVITQQPTDQVGNAVKTATFSTSANVTNATFQWEINQGSGFTNITESTVYLGTTTTNLVITNAPITLHSAVFRCRVSSSGCTIPSSSAKYTYQAVITSPSAQSTTSPFGGNIVVDLGGNIDRNTVAGQTLAVHAMQTGRLIDDKIANFSVSGSVITLDPANDFKAGERVFVSATAGLLYENGAAVQPVVWEFRTGVSTSVNRSFLATGQQLGGSVVNDVALGDMNGDRLVDALVGTSSGMALWLNDGKGQFTLSGQTLGNTAIASVILGDVDSDTDLDVVEIKSDGTFSIWKNDGAGFLSTSATGLGSNARAVSIADLNGDGHLDLFVACSGADLVCFNNGTGAFSNSGQSLGTDDSSSVDVGDLDGDGDLDAFVATRSNQSEKVWINNGTGTFSDNGQTLGSATSEKVVLADVNDDFRPDAVVVGASSTVWLNNGAGQFSTRIRQDVTRPGDAITQSSANSPGAEGVAKVIDNSNTTKWLNFDKLNVSCTVTPTVRPAIVSALGITSANDSPERDPASFRLEGSLDGINFTVITNSAPIPAFSARAQTNTISFENTAAYNHYRLTFLTLSNAASASSMQVAEVELIDEAYDLGGSARSVATGDINGDGKLDLWISYVGNTNQIFVNNGLNNFSPLPGTLQNSSSGPLALGDLNGDGALDLFQGVGGANNGSLAWLYINPPKVLNEDILATFTSGEFTNRFTKGMLTDIRVVAPPANGTLKLNGIAVFAGQEIPFSSLDSLSYLPSTNFFGTDSFDWQGATSNGFIADLLSFNLQINGVQDAPIVPGGSITVAMAGTATLLDSGASSVLQNASDPDGDALSASIVTNAMHGSLTLNANGTFSYTHNGTANFSDSFVFRASDGNGNFTAATIAITVYQVNVAPTNIVLTGNSIAENQVIGTVIGTLGATDANGADTHAFTLVSGSGSTDNAWFSVDGNALKSAAIFNYETKTNYSIRVRTTDNGGLFFEKAFTVSISNVNEAPVINGPTTVSFSEETTGIVATYTVTDPDAVDTVTWSRIGVDANRFTIDSTGNLRFSAIPDFENPQDAGGNNIYDVTVVATDSGAISANRSVQVTVTNAADGPAFISLPVTNAIVGLPYAYHIDVLHPKKLAMTVTAPVLPPWLTFNPGGGGTFVSGFAGTDAYGNADGPQAQASFNDPYDVAINTNGVIYVTDRSGARLCKIENGLVTTLPFTFTSVRSVAVDPQGNIYVTDEIGNAIRKISGGIMTTVVAVNRPNGLAVDDLGNIFFTQKDNYAISKYTPGSGVSIFAGHPSFAGFWNATGTEARFSMPEGLAVDSSRNVYVADFANYAIRKITSAGVVTTWAGNGTPGSANGFGTSATFQPPTNVEVDNVGNVYVADTYNYKVRKIASNQQVTTLAGDGSIGKKDGIGSVAQFGNLYGMAATPDGSTVYVCDGYSRIREIGPTPPTISGTPAFSHIGPNIVRLEVTDGLQTTAQEFVITVADYPPMIGSLTPIGPHWQIRFTGLAGQTYIIQYKTNLSSSTWTEVGPPVEVSPGVYEVYDYEPVDKSRYYRMRTP